MSAGAPVLASDLDAFAQVLDQGAAGDAVRQRGRGRAGRGGLAPARATRPAARPAATAPRRTCGASTGRPSARTSSRSTRRWRTARRRWPRTNAPDSGRGSGWPGTDSASAGLGGGGRRSGRVQQRPHIGCGRGAPHGSPWPYPPPRGSRPGRCRRPGSAPRPGVVAPAELHVHPDHLGPDPAQSMAYPVPSAAQTDIRSRSSVFGTSRCQRGGGLGPHLQRGAVERDRSSAGPPRTRTSRR